MRPSVKISKKSTGGKIINYKELMNKLRDVFKGNSKSELADLRAFLL